MDSCRAVSRSDVETVAELLGQRVEIRGHILLDPREDTRTTYLWESLVCSTRQGNLRTADSTGRSNYPNVKISGRPARG